MHWQCTTNIDAQPAGGPNGLQWSWHRAERSRHRPAGAAHIVYKIDGMEQMQICKRPPTARKEEA
jgi:hypothetical protein